MNECVCAITGHRPSRFKFKYSEDYALCKRIKASMLEVFRKLHDEKEVRRFYVGVALGVDMWAAEQILRLKEQPGYENIELVVALPFVGHDAKWDQRSKRRMEFILQHCRPTTWWQFMTMCELCDPGQCSVSDMRVRTMFR